MWWSATVYNWVREHCSLHHPLESPVGKKRFQQRTPDLADADELQTSHVAEAIQYRTIDRMQ